MIENGILLLILCGNQIQIHSKINDESNCIRVKYQFIKTDVNWIFSSFVMTSSSEQSNGGIF